jgi:hypothetical protein
MSQSVPTARSAMSRPPLDARVRARRPISHQSSCHDERVPCTWAEALSELDPGPCQPPYSTMYTRYEDCYGWALIPVTRITTTPSRGGSLDSTMPPTPAAGMCDWGAPPSIPHSQSSQSRGTQTRLPGHLLQQIVGPVSTDPESWLCRRTDAGARDSASLGDAALE